MASVRCYLRYGLPYRDVEELLAERGSRCTPAGLFVRPSTGLLAVMSHEDWADPALVARRHTDFTYIDTIVVRRVPEEYRKLLAWNPPAIERSSLTACSTPSTWVNIQVVGQAVSRLRGMMGRRVTRLA